MTKGAETTPASEDNSLVIILVVIAIVIVVAVVAGFALCKWYRSRNQTFVKTRIHVSEKPQQKPVAPSDHPSHREDGRHLIQVELKEVKVPIGTVISKKKQKSEASVQNSQREAQQSVNEHSHRDALVGSAIVANNAVSELQLQQSEVKRKSAGRRNKEKAADNMTQDGGSEAESTSVNQSRLKQAKSQNSQRQDN